MKKPKIYIVFLMFMVTMLASCSNNENTSSTTDNAKEGTKDSSETNATELTLWTFVGLHADFYQDALVTWNEENPERQIDLNTESFPVEQMHNNLLMALQSGTGAPDMADIQIDRTPNFMAGDIQLFDLTRVVEPYKDKIVMSLMQPYTKGGKYYAIPTHIGADVMYYNMEIMDEAGVDPADIVTWDDYVEAGKKVVAATGKPMTTIETDDQLYYWALISQQGSDYYDEDLNVTLDNETNINTLQFVYDMVYEHKIAELTPGGGHHAEEYYAQMGQGAYASVHMPLWYMGRFIEYMPDLKGKVKIYPLPSWDPGGNRTTARGGTGTAVTNQSEHPELAAEFLEHAKLTEEANFKTWEVLGFDPINFDVWDDPRILEDNQFYQYFGNNIFDVLNDIRDEFNPTYLGESTPDLTHLLTTNALHNVLREQTKTPEEALKEVAGELR